MRHHHTTAVIQSPPSPYLQALNSTPNDMDIIDGKRIAQDVKKELTEQVARHVSQGFRAPHLAAILVGDNPASHAYVRMKVKACGRTGMASSVIRLPDSISEAELLNKIQTLNLDERIDGFIVQLPLPEHMDTQKVIMSIDPNKDVDGFHPMNLGKMILGLPSFLPATPAGIWTLLERGGIQTEGQHCVVLGRSHIVGTPMSLLLSRKHRLGNATVTLAHSRTKNLTEITQQADILIAAIGRPYFVTSDMVKEGAVVIDVGINRIIDKSSAKGYRLIGDVDYDQVSKKCRAITPVPGGVGPMTVVSLLQNTLQAAKLHPAQS